MITKPLRSRFFMSDFMYDLFTIGAGSGGVRASRMAAAMGKKVAVAEERHYGGTCVNIGCVPKKLMVYASHFSEDFEDAAGYGWTVPPAAFDWSTLIANKDKEIERLNGIYERLLQNAGVTIYDGRARIVDPHTVSVNGETITAERILIATGGRPVRPEQPGSDYGLISDDFFYLKEMPKRVLVVGGGYIAVEFAGILNGLGAQVTQIYRGPLFLRGFDDEVRMVIAEEMRKKGIDLRFETHLDCIQKEEAGGYTALLTGGTQETDQEALPVDAVFYAVGRKPYVDDLGLENTKVTLNKAGAIAVDSFYQTTEPSIYAIGDVTDRVNLTPVALAEGMTLVKHLFQGEQPALDYSNIPTAVFSQPPIGTVGLTEAQARDLHGAVDVYTSSFRAMKFSMSGRDERSFMKLIVDPKSDKVLGAHMVGADAAEIMQGLGIAMKCGATKAHFDATIGIHPSAAEEFVTMREKRPDPSEMAAE